MKDSLLKRMLLKVWDKYNDVKRLHHVRKHYSLSVMSAEETIDYIKKHKCSVARYGDGEFSIMLQYGAPAFENGSKKMSKALLNVFENQGNLLICVPSLLVEEKGLEKRAKNYWRNWALQYQQAVVSEIRRTAASKYVFGDAYISRPYSAYETSENAEKIFPLLKELWAGQDVLIVEGEKTRLGIGNDLFTNTKSIKRILAPAENAFAIYSEILQAVIANWNGELVVLALGPTATILASDLSKQGIQALDLGHIDVQYEWYLRGDKNFKPIPGKYVNESIDGREVGASQDEDYLSQIITTINGAR